jgi:hypothetical protein
MKLNRRRLTAAAAAFVLAGAISGTAVASTPPYTVNIKVPSTVTVNSHFIVVAYGESANLSGLLVFLSDGKCKRTAAGEKAAGGALVLASKVVGSYKRTRGLTARFPGPHAVCAYLRSVPPPSPPLLRARAVKLYTVVALES